MKNMAERTSVCSKYLAGIWFQVRYYKLISPQKSRRGHLEEYESILSSGKVYETGLGVLSNDKMQGLHDVQLLD
jgi:hypothetical protein